jgi:hypothetical protein
VNNIKIDINGMNAQIVSLFEIVNTKVDIDSPVFTGNPTSEFTPDVGSEEAFSNTLATTAFVYSMINEFSQEQPPSTPDTPPTNGGKINQPGGNNKNTLIGGGESGGWGGMWGLGGENEHKTMKQKATNGKSGEPGNNGAPGFVKVYKIPGAVNILNWNIATYVHESE